MLAVQTQWTILWIIPITPWRTRSAVTGCQACQHVVGITPAAHNALPLAIAAAAA